MKNILFIAYYFPPKGGSGVQRSIKFAKYLGKMGYNVHILTVKEDTKYERDINDKSFLKDIDKNLKIYRTGIDEISILKDILQQNAIKNKSFEDVKQKNLIMEQRKKTKIIKTIVKKAFFKLYSIVNIPDDKKGWIKYALDEGRKIIIENNIDTVISSSYPYSAHQIALKLKRELNIKWVADFRDPWVMNSFYKSQYGFIIKKIYENYERKFINNADKVTVVSGPMKDDYDKRYNLSNEKVSVITNGYDEEEFSNIKFDIHQTDNKLVVLYTGVLYDQYPTERFISSIENLICNGKIDKERIKLIFIGQKVSCQMNILRNFEAKYPEAIEIIDYISHEKVIDYIIKASALLLMLGETTGKEVYTGKIFEYIRCLKPIIAVVPDGVARELVYKTKTGYLAYPSNLEEIENVIYNVYMDHINNKRLMPDWNEIKKYDRYELTKRLVEIIDK